MTAPFDGRLLAGVSVLSAVIESGTFARAAEVLALSASGVSRAIARLESRLGIRLLERTTRSMTLTEEGRRFFEEVSPHLQAIEDAAGNAAGAVGAVRGRLRVDVDPFLAQVFLARRLGDLLNQYPELSQHLTTREHIGDLIADGIDVGLRFGEPSGSSAIARKLLETKILTVAAPSLLKTPRQTEASQGSRDLSLPPLPRSCQWTPVRLGIPPAARNCKGGHEKPPSPERRRDDSHRDPRRSWYRPGHGVEHPRRDQARQAS